MRLSAVTRKIAACRRKAATLFPAVAPLQASNPIAQVYAGSGNKRTTYTLVNFPSLFSPKTAVPCRYRLTLFDPDGNRVARSHVDVPVYGTATVQPEKFFPGTLPEFGMISAEIRPLSGIRNPYAHLETITSHFYAVYSDNDMGAIAIVHPQTLFSVSAQPRWKWRSNLLIEPSRLDALEIFQINPSSDEVLSTLFLFDSNGEALLREEARLLPHGSRRITWPADLFSTSRYVFIGLDGLTGQNAKPLVFNRFKDGTFSACHG